jgi:lycopene beta-cyclase
MLTSQKFSSGARDMFDALVIGAGPAGTMIAAQLGERGLKVLGLTATPLRAPWPNTYGIWRDELEALGLEHLLGHQWTDCVSYFSQGEVQHHRPYGLFDKTKLQEHLLLCCEAHQVEWREDKATAIAHRADHSCVTLASGQPVQARIVIDATGHRPLFVERDQAQPVAYQAAYGVVGRCSAPPVDQGQFVLMDYRNQHLSAADSAAYPPTFLYAMDLGQGLYFLEETSLASDPAVPFEVLERRLHERLASRNITITEVHEVERCLFPMNLPMPSFEQTVVAFGGAASMVHPASGYSVGAMLRRAPDFADAIAFAVRQPNPTPHAIAQQAWQALWPQARLRKYYLYRFGLEKLMRFDQARLQHFFDTFFALPKAQWSGFLADGLTPVQLVAAMVQLFGQAPNDVRWGLMQFPGSEAALLWKFLTV